MGEIDPDLFLNITMKFVILIMMAFMRLLAFDHARRGIE